MPYLFTVNRNFEDYASGRVFYTQAGQPAFPVRLASEIFQRALRHWRRNGGEDRIHLYDPVCGGAYWLSVLAYLHWQEIAMISASDVDGEVLPLAERNLSLLTPAGLDQRITEIEKMLDEFGKTSHAAALESARRFRQYLHHNRKINAITLNVFRADATDPESMRRGLKQAVDLVLADVPYGYQSEWQRGHGGLWTQNEGEDNPSPVEAMLEALRHILKPEAVIAVTADKAQKIHPENYRRLERFQIGKRRVFILTPH